MQVGLFRKFALFAELDVEELKQIAAVAKPRRYARDDAVIHEDERGDVFCLIQHGRVKITMTSPEGKELILSTLGPGEFFGEMALLDDNPRSASVIATEKLEVLTIWRSDFVHFERLVLLEEVIEVLLYWCVDRVPYRRGPRVEVDEHGFSVLRHGEGEIDRKRRLADAPLSRGNWNDSFHLRGCIVARNRSPFSVLSSPI